VRLLGLLERGGEADPALRALVGWAAATGVGSDLSLPDAVAVVDVLRAVDQVEIVLDPGLRNALLDSCRTALEHHCRAPGVYSLLRGAEPGTYATFLGWLVEQGLGVEERPPERPGFLLGMRRPDGGFSESQACPRSAVNPTAAAVAVLLGEGGGLELDELGAVRDFVAANQTPEGGIRSGNGAVGPDLLSTFTGLVCLNRLRGRTALRLGDLARFVRDCGLPAGGFRAAPGQGAPDVEYTYYGLGALALLRLVLDHASTLCPSR
jgi:geranylgeranyl transferase type-2 subunit beta